MVSNKVKATRKRSLLKILQRTTKSNKSSSAGRYKRHTYTAEKRKASTKTSRPRRRAAVTKSRSRTKSRKQPSRKVGRGKCKGYLKSKIRTNIEEYKQGRYKSRAQAVAVSYSQVMKKHPSCRRVLKRHSN
jgi:hypothetical protein